MSHYNKIFAKVIVGSVAKEGKPISLSIATKTSTWVRDEKIAQTQAPFFQETVEANLDLVPKRTVEVCQRESKHPSPEDPREHITGVCFDENGDGKSIHFPTKR